MNNNEQNQNNSFMINRPNDQFYNERQRASELVTEISTAKKQVILDILSSVKEIQKRFMENYSDKLYELEYIENNIQRLQESELIKLNYQISKLHQLKDQGYDKEQIKDLCKKLNQEYRDYWFPKDSYYKAVKDSAQEMKTMFYDIVNSNKRIKYGSTSDRIEEINEIYDNEEN